MAIKINEIRVGNSVKSLQTNRVVTIDLFLLGEFADDETYLDHLNPIPLTPEILIACGFKSNENASWYELDIPDDSDGQQISLSATKITKEHCAVLLMHGICRDGMDAFTIAEVFKDDKREDYPHGIGYISKENTISIRHVKYLHQLQNLFYSLTQTELIFQPSPTKKQLK